MNYKQILLAASVACAAVTGCEEVEINRAVHTFFYPIRFAVDAESYRSDIILRFSDNANYSADNGDYHKERYKKYVYYFSDFGYREDDEWCWGCDDDLGPNHPSSVCVCDIKSIHIVSDNDFDAKHPAGSNADDLFTITMESAYPFIKNGYAPKYDQHSNQFQLNDIDPDYLKLNGLWFAYLHLKNKPQADGEYSFTVSVEMSADPVTNYTPTLDPQSFTLTFNSQKQ